MRAWTLGSGSRGNAMIVESGGRRLLVDCGYGPRSLAARLKVAGIAPESIEGVLITHEHQDHADGLARCQQKWRWPVHASAPTLAALRVPMRWQRPLEHGATAQLDAFSLEGVAVPHDAAAPSAFVITDRASGARLGFAHDLGHVPVGVARAFVRCDALCIEANHDVVMLREGPYPASLQGRVRGGRGHLNNDEAGALVAALAHPGLRAVVLLHLSENNNVPALAERTVAAAARRVGYAGVVRAAAGRQPMEAFDLGREGHAVIVGGALDPAGGLPAPGTATGAPLDAARPARQLSLAL